MRRLDRRQAVRIERLVFRRRLLKTSDHGRPEFHAIQIVVQAIECLHEIADDHILDWFRHGRNALGSGRGLFLLWASRAEPALRFRYIDPDTLSPVAELLASCAT